MRIVSTTFAPVASIASATMALCIAWIALGATDAAFAAGGGGGGGGGGGFSVEQAPTSSSDRRAQRSYDSARKSIERALKYREEAAAESDPKKRAKLEDKARDRLERAERDLGKAISRKDGYFQAYSDLGFTLRSLGRYDEALVAYDEALEIESGYMPAVEYRGEAYLELGRLDDAAAAYQRLAYSTPDLAEQLLAKMRAWVERKRTDPGDLDPSAVEAFGSWVERRSSRSGGDAAPSAW